MTPEELEKLVTQLRAALSQQQQDLAAASRKIASLERTESLILELVNGVVPLLGVMAGAMKVVRDLEHGTEVLDRVKQGALVEYPKRDEQGTTDAKNAVWIAEFFERIDLAAQSASGKGNLN